MNKKAILIIGPRGSGKTTKMREITKGRKIVIQYGEKPFVPGEPGNYPDYMVFEDVQYLNDPFFLRSFLAVIDFSSAVTILISQAKREDLSPEYISPDIEIIDLHQPTN